MPSRSVALYGRPVCGNGRVGDAALMDASATKMFTLASQLLIGHLPMPVGEL
jgi:hypothetical protein